MNSTQPSHTERKKFSLWYIPAALGICFMALGCYTFLQPVRAYIGLSFLFGYLILLSGVWDITMAIFNRKQNPNWLILLAFGFLGISIGCTLLLNTALSMEALPMYVGFVILLRSINAINYYYAIRKLTGAPAGSVLYMGILGMILACIMIFFPGLGGLSIVLWTGLSLLLIGIYELLLGLKLYKLAQ